MRAFMLAVEPTLIQGQSQLDRDNSRKTPQRLATAQAPAAADSSGRCRNPSTCLSHWPIRFQLVKIWVTRRDSEPPPPPWMRAHEGLLRFGTRGDACPGGRSSGSIASQPDLDRGKPDGSMPRQAHPAAQRHVSRFLVVFSVRGRARIRICPHGRRVMLRLTRRQVEKNFQRI